MTTKSQIAAWFDRGVAQGASHMIVVCDSFSHEDYPVFTSTVEEARERVAAPGDMQRVMEIYNLSMDKEKQMNETHARNF